MTSSSDRTAYWCGERPGTDRALAGRRRRPRPATGGRGRGSALVGVTTLLLVGGTVLPGTAAQAASLTGPALSVDATADQHPISPDIYGLNFADPSLAEELRLPVDRWGGNNTSRYNWQNNTRNTGSDWYFENIVEAPADSVDSFVTSNAAHGTRSLVTVPLIGSVAKNSPASHPFACGYPRTRFPSQQDFDSWDANCGNGRSPDGTPLPGAVPADTSVAAGPDFVSGYVTHLAAEHGTASAGGVGLYELDNEPALWNSTHRDVHPAPVTYDELVSRSTSYAAAVKASDPSAATLGPSDWGWCAYFYSAADPCGPGADRTAHGNIDVGRYYLRQMKASAEAHGGQRLLDYFDEHYYPQANGVALNSAGDAARQALRLRSTRSLWDPTYTDESWIGTDVGAPPIQLIPRFRSWINADYPGTKLAITEYNFGGLESMNGALAQADALGIFAREGLDLATLWGPPRADQPGAYAFRMYRNYDGHGGSFGDTWARATSADQDKVAIYAATRRFDGALTALAVNKTGDDLTSPLTIAGADTTGTAQVWRYSAANPSAIVRDSDVAVAGGSAPLTLPANSLTLLVLPPPPHGTPPTAPTEPTATAGDGSATVSWTAPADGSPITSYQITAHHDGTDNPSATVIGYPPEPRAIVPGLTNGSPYTFTITATNAVGTSAASAPSAPVTPIGKPAAPTGVTASAGDATATVSWAAPTDTGGSPITGYAITANPGGVTATTDGATRSAEVPGLTNGTPYTFTVTATNAVGESPPSSPSAPPVIPATSPDQVVRVTLDSDPNPSPLGGSVQFTVTVTRGGKPAPAGVTSIWDVTDPGYVDPDCPIATPSTYVCVGTFSTPGPHQLIADYNVWNPERVQGQSPPYTQQVTDEPPQPTPPGAPTNVTTTVVGALATVTWTAPSDGGSQITGYQVIAHHDGRNEPQEPVIGTPLIPRVDVRLSPGTAYTFTVLATNAVGTSPASAPSPPVSAQPPPTVTITSKPANPTNSRTGTIEFTVSRPTATTCQLDSARPAACTSPVSYTDLAEGGHRVTVTATDTSGSGSATAEWTVDLTPPTVTLTTKPPAITNSRTATFGFTVNEPAFITCKLDNDNTVLPAVSCYSPRIYTNLTAGRHTVTITATDTAGNRAPPAVVSWTVDLTAPTVALTVPTTGATTNRTATVKWTGTDAPAGIAGYDLSVQRYTLAGKPEPVSYPLTNTPLTATTLTLTAGKTTCLRVRAHDRAGNISDWTPSRCVSVPADERALTASTGWTRVTKTGYYTDTYTWTARAGATMTTPTTKVAKAWLVATRCPGCGTVGIYLGTTQVGTVNLNAVTTQRAAILPAYAGTPRSGLLTLRVLTNGKRVELDGLALAPQ
jgi:hypothetical protein